MNGNSVINRARALLTALIASLSLVIFFNLGAKVANNRNLLNKGTGDYLHLPYRYHIATSKEEQPSPISLPHEVIVQGCPNPENHPRHPHAEMRGEKYWVLYNHILPDYPDRIKCNETITYTTQGEFQYLHNLLPIVDRWRGPVSVAVYAPGFDYNDATRAAIMLRGCDANNSSSSNNNRSSNFNYYYQSSDSSSALIRKYVTFHFFFDLQHIPERIYSQEQLAKLEQEVSCDEMLTFFTNISKNMSFRNAHNLLYPVNVGRNIARVTATTQFIFPADIELYPSPGLIPGFLSMISNSPHPADPASCQVYPVAIFELHSSVSKLPLTKSELISLVNTESAIPFHAKTCRKCHKIPNESQWLADRGRSNRMFVASTSTRHHFWEPIFIGTHDDPLYDERLSWEGYMDKMSQALIMCILNYKFKVLSSAFLIHRPGEFKTIKKDQKNSPRERIRFKQGRLVRGTILKEIETIFGTRSGCRMS